MRRSLAVALLLGAFLGASAGARAAGEPPAGAGDNVLLRVGTFRVTRGEFDRRYAPVLAPLAGDRGKERSERARLAFGLVQDLLLAEYARKHVVRDEGLLEDMRRNAVNEYLVERWLGPRVADAEGEGPRRQKALSIVAELERKEGVKLLLPLLGTDGKVPPDDRVVAEVGQEKVRFRRVRATLCANYAGFSAWPAGADEAALRSGLEAVVRLEVVARAARKEKGAPPGDPEGAEWLYRERLTGFALARMREEAFRPDPQTEAKVRERLPLRRSELHAVRVIVFKAEDPQDLADFRKALTGVPTENKSAGSRITEVKFRRMAEYWLPKGFLPLPVELAAMAVPPGKQFSETVLFSGEHYLVRILERGEPPYVDVDAERRRLEEKLGMQKYQKILQETVAKARAETEVEVSPELL